MARTTDALAQLRDIHYPPPIKWWPLAPGWIILIGLLLLFTFALAYFLYQKQRQARPKKQALRLLTQYQHAFAQEHNSQLTSAQVSELLRRVALVYYPRNEVASLHGHAWLDFLTRTSHGIDFNSFENLLLVLPFKPSESTDLKPLFVGAERWIKQRRATCLN